MNRCVSAIYYGDGKLKSLEISIRDLSLIVIFTAVTFVFTTIITIATPATRGFINIGETGVYLSALIGGPLVGAIAGGLGSALADIALGYYWYAPGTFIIKSIEGFLAGWLSRKIVRTKQYTKIIIAALVSIMLIAFLWVMAYGGIEISIIIFGNPIEILIPFWLVIGIAIGLGVVFIILALIGKVYSDLALACLISGVEMVFGYYLYETLLFGAKIALVEVLPNFIQPIAGIIIGIPIVLALMEMGVDVDIARFIRKVQEEQISRS